MTPQQRLDAAKARLEITAIAVYRARQACNGEHTAAELRKLLTDEDAARRAHAEAIFTHGQAYAAVHGQRETV